MIAFVAFLSREEFALELNRSIGVGDLLPAIAIERQQIAIDFLELVTLRQFLGELLPLGASYRLVCEPLRRIRSVELQFVRLVRRFA